MLRGRAKANPQQTNTFFTLLGRLVTLVSVAQSRMEIPAAPGLTRLHVYKPASAKPTRQLDCGKELQPEIMYICHAAGALLQHSL